MLTHLWSWWIAEFVLSSVLWLVLAPSFSAFIFRKTLAHYNGPEKNLERQSLNYIFGFSFVFYGASFLIAFHRDGLIILFFALILFALKNKIVWLKPHWSDAVIVIPILVALALLPVVHDSNLDKYQFSLFRDFWPLDWRNRLDTHFGVSGLFHYWQPSVPMINRLAVQGPFLALLFWRILVFCWLTFKKRTPRVLDWCFLVTLYLGSLFYRKEIHVKASPVGGIFVLLVSVILATSAATSAFGEVALGWLLACPFIFGEYGFLILVPLLIFILISNHDSKKLLTNSVPFMMLFMTPELLRKIFIASQGSARLVVAVLLIWLLLIFTTKKFGPQIIGMWRGIPKFETILFVTLTSLCLVLPLVSQTKQLGEGAGFNFIQWTIGREGLIFLGILFYLWKNRLGETYKIFILYLSVQFLMFFALQFMHGTGLSNHFNPNLIWWNLHKNSIMIAMPVFTTLVGALFLEDLFARNQTQGRVQKVLPFLVLGFFVFLQDPLVKSYGDGPLSPYAPRLSAQNSVRDALWTAQTARDVFSKDGDLILWPPLAVHEPELVEDIYKLQRESKTVLRTCLDMEFLKKVNAADFDIKAYTIEIPTGAAATLGEDSNCDLNLLAKPRLCKSKGQEIAEGDVGVLCKGAQSVSN